MTRVLVTGGTGFVGRNVIPILQERFEVVAPKRVELDLSDETCVAQYLEQSDAEFLVHCAIVNPDKEIDCGKGIYDDTMRAFETLIRHPFKKIVYIGSGAEYDKTFDIAGVTEEDVGTRVPSDEYGLVKLAMNEIARKSDNIFNLRIFGCYGRYEPERRFLRHAIGCCLKGEELTIRRDCRFSYVNVVDLGRAMIRFLDGSPRHHDYNICGGRPYLLSELAEIVRRRTGTQVSVRLLAPGLANEYTGSDVRFKKEFPDFVYMPIEAGIDDEIAWMREEAL